MSIGLVFPAHIIVMCVSGSCHQAAVKSACKPRIYRSAMLLALFPCPGSPPPLYFYAPFYLCGIVVHGKGTECVISVCT